MVSDIETRLEAIEARNQRVEADKAWEVSWVRRLLIIVITYVVAGLVLLHIHAEEAWLNAVIPTCGYLLSTLSLPPIKAFWIRRRMVDL